MKAMNKYFVWGFVWLLLAGAGWGQTISVTLFTPNGGEHWEAGATKNITWETSGTPESVNIYSSFDNGATWSSYDSGAPDTGSHTWSVPLSITDEARIRIEAVKGEEVVTAESAASFFIVDTTPPVVTVSAPAGGENWLGGSAHNVSFSYSDLFSVKPNSLLILYSTDNGVT